ncbi:lactosylceramide 1,3-N-acetyl-beta-D-glucosaminyltransferase-like [Aplysia californica]|uniref:Hexosyltransferase n=1 Tax=Aplysia californica TaxID=6500 RepID=A0ABM0JWP1_APLCA|nr:lactosylceramide 1,3-N-acetyl-beta-D-glucosaminyltransferase-like [Aplysia californica]
MPRMLVKRNLTHIFLLALAFTDAVILVTIYTASGSKTSQKELEKDSKDSKDTDNAIVRQSFSLHTVETLMRYCWDRQRFEQQPSNSTLRNATNTNSFFSSCVLDSLSYLELSEMDDDEIRLLYPTYAEEEYIHNTNQSSAQSKASLTSSNLSDFLSQPIINPHDNGYTLNLVTFCADSDPDVLVIIPSAPGNFQRRQKTRQRLGSTNNVSRDSVQAETVRVKSLFFLGIPNGDNATNVQNMILEEFSLYQDIVQENFSDVYSNIRIKAVGMLKWVSEFCPQAKMVIRSDDDVTINNMTALLNSALNAYTKQDNFIIGAKLWRWLPNRHKCSKYYVSEKEYPDFTYPPGFRGGLLAYPIKTAKLLFEASLRVKSLWLDDVYITGLCSSHINATLLVDENFAFRHRPEQSERVMYNKCLKKEKQKALRTWPQKPLSSRVSGLCRPAWRKCGLR